MTREEKKPVIHPVTESITQLEQAVDKLVKSDYSSRNQEDENEPKAAKDEIIHHNPSMIINMKAKEDRADSEEEPNIPLYPFKTFHGEKETPQETEVDVDDFFHREKETFQEIEANVDDFLLEEALSIELTDFEEEEVSVNSSHQAEHLDQKLNELSQTMEDKFSSVESQMNKLMRDFQTKLMIDEQKNQIIDKLHRELQDYKNNENQDRVLPLIRDLLSLIDNVEKQVRFIRENGYDNPEKLIEMIQNTVQDVEDILYRQGIEALSNQSEKFDSKRHKVIKTIKTTDKDKDKQIAEVFGKAYFWEERQIRPERVAVYVYQPDTEAE